MTTTRRPATVSHQGLTYIATGKTGSNFATGNPVAEYRHDDGRLDRRVWRDALTGQIMPG